jgi:uncharacterized membrane protein
MEIEKRSRRVREAGVFGTVLGIIAVFGFAFLMPGMMANIHPLVIAKNFNASIFSTSSVLGFLVIGIVAFLLGITVTVFCFRLKKWEEKQNRENHP